MAKKLAEATTGGGGGGDGCKIWLEDMKFFISPSHSNPEIR